MAVNVLGGAVGLAMGEAIVARVLPRKLSAIPNVDSLGLGHGIAALNDSVGRIHQIGGWTMTPSMQDVALRDAVLRAWARSIASVWMVGTGLDGLAMILTLFLREYSVECKTVSDDLKNAGFEIRWRKTCRRRLSSV